MLYPGGIFFDNPIGVTYPDILRWWYFCDDIGVEQSCAPRHSRALWWLPTFGGDTDKGSSQWHLCMIKIKIKKEVWLPYISVEKLVFKPIVKIFEQYNVQAIIKYV